MASIVKFYILAGILCTMSTGTILENNEKTCLTNRLEAKRHYLHFLGQSLDFTLQTSNRITQQLTTEILKIFLEEIVGYQNIRLVKYTNDIEVSGVFKRFFGSDPQMPTKIPNVMVNLDVSVPPEVDFYKYLNIYPITECGSIAPPGRFGWFIPEALSKTFPNADQWKFFKYPNNAKFFDTDIEGEILIKNNSMDPTTNRFFCETDFCNEGMYIPQQCKGLKNNQSCALMLTSYPESTSFITEHINELKLYIKVVWLGNNLRDAVEKLTNMYSVRHKNRSLLFLEWTPGFYTVNREKLTMISLPNCEYFKSSLGCKYEMTRSVKLAWSELQNIGRPAFEVIHKIKFERGDYENLLNSYNQHNRSLTIHDTACAWMKSNEKIWTRWMPSSIEKKELYIGGIFPLSGASYNAYGIVKAASMAQDAVNSNSTILNDFTLKLLVNDGKCKADIVMKSFIDYIFNNEYQNLIGVLGPACSETVEPLAGVSKHYSTVVISYSAEGSSFSDRSKYPYFFRTIGENNQYKQVYLKFFQQLGWKRVAALTEDGQKYTEYISSMGDMLQSNQIAFIANMKFPRDRDEMSLARYLQDLKKIQARIIIADIYDEVARIVMCQAYKQDMTNRQGYVWFLPPWLSTGWFNTTHYNKYFNESVDCTIDMMISAINGHFSLNYAYFASSNTIMQENISVGDWHRKYSEQVAEWSLKNKRQFNPYTSLNNNDFTSDYAGYAYDAVWTYALAVDKMIKMYPESISDIHSPENTGHLVKLIGETDYTGVSGQIKFHGGPSRFSMINIFQWFNNTGNLVGVFSPNVSVEQPEAIGGTLDLNISAIIWLTADGSKPDDGSIPPEECLIGALADFLNISCKNAFVTLNIFCFVVFAVLLIISITVLKKRYEHKIKLNEEYMKSIGVMNMTNLDKWETTRECVVLNRKLGEGAFGMVYGGEALFVEGKGWVAVAVKTLKVGSTTAEKLDFLSEAESMKRFEHKNIVKLLGVCTKNEPVYTIMEFMLYGDLKTYLLARRHLVNDKYIDETDEISSKKLTSMALDVARALSYLAELKYVHRDVACRNCLVNSQRVVKLGDFGMTRLIFENDYYRFSRKGMLPIRWMAPESLGLGIFTTASDVWSFGVLLYEIITFGSFPFQGLSNNEVLEQVKMGHTLNIPPGIKPQLEGLMKSCWNKEYKTRPHASEIAEFLATSNRLLSPHLDVPLSSIQIEYSGELDILLPGIKNKHSISHIPNGIQQNIESTEVNPPLLNSLHFDNPNYLSAEVNSNNCSNNTRQKNINNMVENITDEEITPFLNL